MLMKLARIAAPFGLSALLFILAYMSSKDSGSGYFPVMLMGIGIVLAIVGIAAIFWNKRASFETDHISPVVHVPLPPL
jgi:protein-S-isoprenylcysteine O-methyltransferase Ste14